MSKVETVKLTEKISIGSGHEPVIIAGPCVMESLEVLEETFVSLMELSKKIGFKLVLKSSFDKANRTSYNSYRGPGLEKGLQWMAELKEKHGNFDLLIDVHEKDQISRVAEIAQVLQIPAFLSRQTDFIKEVAESGRSVNIKKGQFLSPEDVPHVIEKAKCSGNKNICITERGISFGYNNLVVDMRSFPWIRKFGIPVIFDATHSVQLPGGGKGNSSGLREYVPYLSRAAASAGVDGFFFEVHPDPDNALCDGPNMINLSVFEKMIREILFITENIDKDAEY